MRAQLIAQADLTTCRRKAPPWTLLAKAVEEATLVYVSGRVSAKSLWIALVVLTAYSVNMHNSKWKKYETKTDFGIEPVRAIFRSPPGLNFSCWLLAAGR